MANATGFLKDGDNYTLFDYPGATYTQAYGINNSGQIVGYYSDTIGGRHGFLKDGNTYMSFDYPGSQDTVASGINDAGQIVGGFVSTSSIYWNGFVKDGTTFTYLGTGSQYFATGINSTGQIVTQGYFIDGNIYTSISHDHRQSRGPDEGPWKGPRSTLILTPSVLGQVFPDCGYTLVSSSHHNRQYSHNIHVSRNIFRSHYLQTPDATE
jgi:probable HAF family extracellular repeat protein